MDLHTASALFLHVFSGFFAIMNPIGNAPIFLSLVEGFDKGTQARIAARAVVVAFLIVALFTVGGNLIFRLFGITLPAFRIAGGILLFLIAYNLLRGRASRQHHPREEELDDLSNALEIAVSPLGTPLLAGPGTISTALSFVGDSAGIGHMAAVLGIFCLVCLLTYFVFISSETLVEKVPQAWIGVVTRLMGLILSVIAVQMVLEGLKQQLFDT